MARDRPVEVFYDGSCAVCQRSRSWTEARDPRDRLLFRDFRSTPDERLPVSRSRLRSAMWVRTADGSLLEGFAAWRRVLGELPRWRWLGRLLGVPPFSFFGRLVYRAVARWRHLLPVSFPDGRS